MSSFSAGVLLAVDGTWNWNSAVVPMDGRTAETAASWETPENWVGGIVPAGDEAVAYLVPKDQATSLEGETRFIRVPEQGIDLGEINIRQKATLHIFGGPLRFGVRSGENRTFPRIRDETRNCKAYYHSLVSFMRKDTTLNKAFLAGPSEFLSPLRHSNSVRFFGDLWATNTSSTIVDPFPNIVYSSGSGELGFYARTGADAVQGKWRTRKGTSIIRRVGPAHEFAAGMKVSAEGFLPEGCFIRRIFGPDSVELSLPALEDSGEAGTFLDFSAIGPMKTIQHFRKLQNQSGIAFETDSSLRVFLVKNRKADSFDVYLDNIGHHTALDCIADYSNRLLPVEGAYPATLHLKRAEGIGKSYFQLNESHVIFEPPEGNSFFVNAIRFGTEDRAASQARVETPAGITVRVGTIHEWKNKVVKEGTGVLDLTLTNQNNNVFCCQEGTGILRYGGTSVPVAMFERLEVSSGATLHAADNLQIVLKTGNIETGAILSAEEDATIDLSLAELQAGTILKGPGTFVLQDSSLSPRIVCVDSPVIRYLVQGGAQDVGIIGEISPSVIGHPAFWVAADKNVDTYTENGVAYVSCWRDYRDDETAYYATNDYSRIITEAKPYFQSPRLEPGAVNGLPRVVLQTVSIEREGKLIDYRQIWTGLIWNQPITNIYAVFHVTWQGHWNGQAFLGCTKRFESMGNARNANDFMRGVLGNEGGGIATAGTRFLNSRAAACVREGTFYDNGRLLASYTNSIPERSSPVVAEIHPREPGGRADAFAIQEHGGVTCSGCQYSLECLVYTNQLSMAEREQVCAYLMKKWGLGKLVWDLNGGRFSKAADLGTVDLAEDIGYCVDAGRVLGINSLQGNGTLAKIGGGDLYVDAADGARLDLRGGRTIVHSGSVLSSISALRWRGSPALVIEGSQPLVLRDPAEVEVEILENGTIQAALEVCGALSAESGVIRLHGDCSRLPIGSCFPLLVGENLNWGEEWSIETDVPQQARAFSLVRKEDGLYLSVYSRGLLIFLH